MVLLVIAFCVVAYTFLGCFIVGAVGDGEAAVPLAVFWPFAILVMLAMALCTIPFDLGLKARYRWTLGRWF